jgi:hypothetical protein
MLEGGLCLLKGGLLLLEPTLRLLPRALLLAELLPHCSKRSDLLRQVSPGFSASLAFSMAWPAKIVPPQGW